MGFAGPAPPMRKRSRNGLTVALRPSAPLPRRGIRKPPIICSLAGMRIRMLEGRMIAGTGLREAGAEWDCEVELAQQLIAQRFAVEIHEADPATDPATVLPVNPELGKE